MTQEKKYIPIGNCVKCGKNAKWNTPAITKNNDLYCDVCKYEIDELTHGVEQWLDDDGNYKIDENGCFSKLGILVVQAWKAAWYDSGRRTYPLDDDEKVLLEKNPEGLIDSIYELLQSGFVKCTSCKKIIAKEQVAGYPLFSGVACRSCWTRHQEEVEKQRKTGDVCRLCRQPRSICCC